MKNIQSFLLLLVALLGLSSCDSFLNVEPQTQIPSEQVLTSGTNVESVLIAAYSDLVSGNFLGSRVQRYSEILGDNIALGEISFNATDFTGQVAFRSTNILNKDIDDMWLTAYRAISRANAVIFAVETGTITDGTPDEEQEIWRGEALFIRAVAHFELTRLFSQPYSNNPNTDLGIPVRIEFLSSDQKLPRATVAQVYDQVEIDLSDAVDALPANNGNRASEWVAKAYLARVLFDKLDYENAFVVAQDVIENSGIGLSGNVLTPFRNVGNVNALGGVIFQIVTGGNSFGDFRLISQRFSIAQGSNSAFDIIVASMNDERSSEGFLSEAGDRVFSNKWDANVLNIPIIRIAEMYLIHAESAVRLTTPDLLAAASSYNALRGFYVSPFTPVTFNSASAALTLIQRERRIELVFEGDRYHDLRRRRVEGFGEVRAGTDVLRSAVDYNSPQNLFKIPVSETSGNPNLVQNP